MYTYQAKSNSRCYLVCIWPQPKAVSHHGVCIPEQGIVYESQKPQTSGIDWTAGVMCGYLKHTAFLKEYRTFIEENNKWKLPIMGKTMHPETHIQHLPNINRQHTFITLSNQKSKQAQWIKHYANNPWNRGHLSFDINSGDWVKDLKRVHDILVAGQARTSMMHRY